MNATLTANVPAYAPKVSKIRTAFYALSLPVIVLFSFLAIQSYPEASLVNGHDPLELSAQEMGYSSKEAQWLAKRNLSSVRPYPGYTSGELL